MRVLPIHHLIALFVLVDDLIGRLPAHRGRQATLSQSEVLLFSLSIC